MILGLAQGILINDVSEGLTILRWLAGRQIHPDKLPVLIETYRSIVESMHRCDQHALPLLIGGQSIADRIAILLSDKAYIDGLIPGVVDFGHPFHPLIKPDCLRAEHLEFC